MEGAEVVQKENEMLWRLYAESDECLHQEYCSGVIDNCFWCERSKVIQKRTQMYEVTEEDLLLFKQYTRSRMH